MSTPRFTALVALLFAGCSSISTDEREVLATVQAFFDVIESRDVDRGAKLTHPDGVFVNTRTTGDETLVRHFRNAEWLEELASGTEHYREYFDGAPTVLVDGDVAVVWARYVFEVDGERSHTGVDAFNLVRTADGWKICGGAYSVVR